VQRHPVAADVRVGRYLERIMRKRRPAREQERDDDETETT